MLNKNLIVVFILGLLFTLVSSVNAQEKPAEKKENKMMEHHDDMQKCMDKIASDSTMRMQMMDKMMDKSKNNKEGMMQMYKSMIDNPEMHKMMIDNPEMHRKMMKMMNDKGMMNDEGMMNEGMMRQNMMDDSTKTMKK